MGLVQPVLPGGPGSDVVGLSCAWPAGSIKFAMQLTRLGREVVRAPRLPLAGEERQKIEAIVRRAIATRPTLA
jgi:hypothetical protein